MLKINGNTHDACMETPWQCLVGRITMERHKTDGWHTNPWHISLQTFCSLEMIILNIMTFILACLGVFGWQWTHGSKC